MPRTGNSNNSKRQNKKNNKTPPRKKEECKVDKEKAEELKYTALTLAKPEITYVHWLDEIPSRTER